jgi:hypothetical protein
VVAKVTERSAVCKQAAQKFDVEIFNLRKIIEKEIRIQYQIKVSNRVAALKNMNDSENLQENIKTSDKRGLVCMN